jgi:hypothetical protein
MHKHLLEHIDTKDNIIIGIGDSFTQGTGAYPVEIWEKHTDNRFFNLDGCMYIEMQHQNSWPKVLADLLDFKVINLGIGGIGNRAAVKELYLSNPLKNHKGNVIVIFMMSGMNRLDFVRKDYDGGKHLRWITLWPLIRDLNTPLGEIEKNYATHLYSEKFSAIETILSIVEAQNFCKLNGYKFVFGSAFDNMIGLESLKKLLGSDKHLLDLIDWTNFIKPAGFKTFMEMICSLEGDKKLTFYNFYEWCSKLNLPSKYLTPCVHWTIEGQRLVAVEIFNFLKENKYIIFEKN